MPHLGLIRSAFLFGLLNAFVALWALLQFSDDLRWPKLLRGSAIVVILLLSLGFVYSTQMMSFSETAAFQDPVIFAKSTKYQRIVLTKSKYDLKLFLNGNLQFSARDEYRYHEALVHVGMGTLKSHQKILILGGGDGLALREVLKYQDVASVTLVDLDPVMTELFSSHNPLKTLNHASLNDPRAHVVSADAYSWLRSNNDTFDFVIVDFPDPSNFSLGKLYSLNFYKELKRAIAPLGASVVQSTSPYYAKKSLAV